jgi:hypothetical protein
MSTGLLEQRVNYPNTSYEYGYGSGGNVDVDGNGRKEVDCSHLLNLMLKDAGYNIPYRSTAQLNIDSTHFESISLEAAQPGDIALWTSMGHTGVVESFAEPRVKGMFFGSQTSTGPKSARFGAGSGYWPMPNKYLRPKNEYRNTTSAVTPLAPTPSPATLPGPTSSASTINFQYPIRKADGSQFENAEELFKLLEAETSGHFLLGNHGFWHGGIHISEKSAPHCKLYEPVRCIADGEVVAYRLNNNYQQSVYANETLNYSTSFCLVKHRYESPKNQVEGPNNGKQNTLTFFSLYMHLLPYERYPVSDEEVKRRVKVTASSLRVRGENNLTSPSLGYIATGAELEIISVQSEYRTNTEDTSTYELAEALILKGTVKDGNTFKAKAGDTVWLALSHQSAGNLKKTFVADLPLPERKQPEYWQGKVKGTVIKEVNARLAPSGEQAGTAIGLLAPMNTELEFDTASIRPLTVGGERMLMAECRLLSGGLKGTGTLPSTFWVCVESKYIQRKPVTTEQFDSVVTCSIAIKAGDPVGFLGLYETPKANRGKTTKHQVHIEVITSDPNLEDFLNNTAGLTEGKQYLRIASGTQLSSKGSSETAPTFTPTESVLTDNCLIEVNKGRVLKDVNGKEWFSINPQTEPNTDISFISKDQGEIVTQHDWKKLGFNIVKEQNENADGFLDPEQMPQFFNALYKEIDEQGNNDGQVCSSELATAMKNPILRERWSKLIAYHPTEWQAKSDQPKWQRLEELLEGVPDLLKHEQERIDNLVFWDSIASVIPTLTNPCVHHLHPLATLKMFMQRGGQLIDVEGFLEKYASQHESFMANTPAFSPVSKNNLRTIVEHINKYYESDPGKANLFELAYMFATARHEAYYFPTGEFFSSKPEVGQLDYFNKYDPVLASTQDLRDTAVDSENTVQGDGYKYRGRGLVHLTWKINYRKAKEHFGIDFVTQPDKAAEPEHSIPIMIWGMKEGIFTGRKLANYINSSSVDYLNARRIINGTDEQALIAGYARKFEAILRETSSAKETFTP